MGDRLSEIIDSSTAALVGIVLICSAVIPTGVKFIGTLTSSAEQQYVPLLQVVLTISIIALIIGILRTFQKER